MYQASEKLPTYLNDLGQGQTGVVTRIPIQLAKDTSLSYWEWLEELVTRPDGLKTVRPQLPNFGKAMMGGGRVIGPPLVEGKLYTGTLFGLFANLRAQIDYPWADLGRATVVDVGGGVGKCFYVADISEPK